MAEKDAVRNEADIAVTRTSPLALGGEGNGDGALHRRQIGSAPVEDLLSLLNGLSVSELRATARAYEVQTVGIAKSQMAEVIAEKLRQPETVRRVAGTLEKRHRQFLAALTLAGGSAGEEDLRGLFERFSLGQPNQLQETITALQTRAFLCRISLPVPSQGNKEKGGTQLGVGWYVPQEVRTALRVAMPVTPFNVEDPQEPSILKLSKPDRFPADLLLIASALDGYHLGPDEGWQLSDRGASSSSSPLLNTPSTDSTLPLPPPADSLPAPLLSILQERIGCSPALLRFAFHLLRLAEIIKIAPVLQMKAETARLLLGPTRTKTMQDLFELWLAQASYGELFELQEDGLCLRCRMASINRSSDLESEHREARQSIIALLAQAPPQQWISFSAFVRSVYRLNPFFLQRRRRHFSTPPWWFEQGEGHALRPLHLNDWLQAEGRYLSNLFCGPLHWWGICDIALGKDGNLQAFRLTPRGNQLLNGVPITEMAMDNTCTISPAESLIIPEIAQLLIPSAVPMWSAIKIVEVFAEKAGVSHGYLCYRLTPAALAKALSHGYHPNHLLNLLRSLATKESAKTQEDVQEKKQFHIDDDFVREADYNRLVEQNEDLFAQTLALVEQWIARYGHARIYTDVSLLEMADTGILRDLSASTSFDDLVVKTIHPTLFVLKKGAMERFIDNLKHCGQFPLIHEEDRYGSK